MFLGEFFTSINHEFSSDFDRIMAGLRYDLTARVAPFLDPLLFRRIEEFNGVTVAPLKEGPSSASSSPSLEAAEQLYQAGKFKEASNMLSELKFDPSSSGHEAQVWGKFAAELLANPEPTAQAVKVPEAIAEGGAVDAGASEETVQPPNETTDVEADSVLRALLGVQDLLDQRRTSESTVQLNRRAWLIHWSLFAYFNGRLPKLVDTFFMSQYMSVIQAACPWVLRYVVVAVVVTHPRSARYNRRVKDVIRVVQQELYEYSDPVLEFVKALYIDFDFENVALKMEEAADFLKNDFFAHSLADQFVDNAKILVANSVLRVHESVSLADLSNVLGIKSAADTKQWIQDYIASKHEAKLDATFDESKETLRVAYSKLSVNSQILEKVKAMDQRAYQLQQSQLRKLEA